MSPILPLLRRPSLGDFSHKDWSNFRGGKHWSHFQGSSIERWKDCQSLAKREKKSQPGMEP